MVAVKGGQVVGALVAVAMVVGGGFLALAGIGYIGPSADTSAPWAMLGSALAGLGVALAISLRQRRR